MTGLKFVSILVRFIETFGVIYHPTADTFAPQTRKLGKRMALKSYNVGDGVGVGVGVGVLVGVGLGVGVGEEVGVKVQLPRRIATRDKPATVLS